MGQVVHTLNEGEVVAGVTSLAGEIYMFDTDPNAGICNGILPLEDKGRK